MHRITRRALLAGVSLGLLSRHAQAQFVGGAGLTAVAGISLPPTASFTISALTPSYDVVSQTFTPASVGTVAATGGSAVYSLSGAQSIGFGVNATTGAITLVTDYLMLEAGVVAQWGKARAFTLTATPVSGPPQTCVVTVNLDTSVYGGKVIPGLDTTVGRTSVNPLKHLVANPPSGWNVYSSTTPTVTTSGAVVTGSGTTWNSGTGPGALTPRLAAGGRVWFSNDYTIEYTILSVDSDTQITLTTTAPTGPVTMRTNNQKLLTASANASLVDYDLPGWRIVCSVSGVSMTQCYMDYLTAPNPAASIALVNPSLPFSVDHCTIICRGLENPWGQAGLLGSFSTITNSCVIRSSVDAATVSRATTCSNTYFSSGATANRQTNGTTYVPACNSWGHADGIQSTGLLTGNSVNYDQVYIDVRAYWFDTSAQSSYRYPAGTASYPNANVNAVVTGSGTSWKTGSVNDRLNVGDWIHLKNGNNGATLVIASVDSDTQVTAVAAAGSTAFNVAAGAQVIVGINPLCGVNNPMFMQGPTASTQEMTGTSSCTNSILRGGGYAVTAGKTYSTLSGTADIDTSGNVRLTVTHTNTIGNLVAVSTDGYAQTYTIAGVTDTTHFAVTPHPGVAISGATMVQGPFCRGATIITDNLIGDYALDAESISRNNASFDRNYSLYNPATLVGGTITPATPYI